MIVHKDLCLHPHCLPVTTLLTEAWKRSSEGTNVCSLVIDFVGMRFEESMSKAVELKYLFVSLIIRQIRRFCIAHNLWTLPGPRFLRSLSFVGAFYLPLSVQHPAVQDNCSCSWVCLFKHLCPFHDNLLRWIAFSYLLIYGRRID